MPLIACGLDKQPWDQVQKILEKVMGHSIIDIKVYTAREKRTEWPPISFIEQPYRIPATTMPPQNTPSPIRKTTTSGSRTTNLIPSKTPTPPRILTSTSSTTTIKPTNKTPSPHRKNNRASSLTSKPPLQTPPQPSIISTTPMTMKPPFEISSPPTIPTTLPSQKTSTPQYENLDECDDLEILLDRIHHLTTRAKTSPHILSTSASPTVSPNTTLNTSSILTVTPNITPSKEITATHNQSRSYTKSTERTSPGQTCAAATQQDARTMETTANHTEGALRRTFATATSPVVEPPTHGALSEASTSGEFSLPEFSVSLSPHVSILPRVIMAREIDDDMGGDPNNHSNPGTPMMVNPDDSSDRLLSQLEKEAASSEANGSPLGIYATPLSSPTGENVKPASVNRKLFSSPIKKNDNQLDNTLATPTHTNNTTQRILRSQSRNKNFRNPIASTPIK